MTSTSTAETWKKRVASWRASGQTAEAFSRGQPWSPRTLRWWSSRLGCDAAPAAAPLVRIAQLVRAPAPERGAVIVEAPEVRLRVTVEPGAPRETVAAVLELLLPKAVR
jgi:hypothetical protein